MNGTPAITSDHATWLSARWLISMREDLIYFIGNVVTSYALLFLNQRVVVSMIPLDVIWPILFDGPHVFGTVSRLYCDAQELAMRTG